MGQNAWAKSAFDTTTALPKALPGFGHVRRQWDHTRQRSLARVMPGEYYVTSSDEVIATVLGSCIAVCLRDTQTHVGGMNHFLLPTPPDAGQIHDDAYYGLHAMELLINAVMKHGGDRRRFEVKVFGAGDVLSAITHSVGARNIQFIRGFMDREGLRLSAEDLGGHYARSIFFAPATGEVWVKRMNSSHLLTIKQREHQFVNELRKNIPAPPKVVIFDED